jgi:hypothetical protein
MASTGFGNSSHTIGNSAGTGSGHVNDPGLTGQHHVRQVLTYATVGSSCWYRQHHQAPVVGSAMVREQAMLRDREAQAFQVQSKELAEAEALEQKAREHRERAVAQGMPHKLRPRGDGMYRAGYLG